MAARASGSSSIARRSESHPEVAARDTHADHERDEVCGFSQPTEPRVVGSTSFGRVAHCASRVAAPETETRVETRRAGTRSVFQVDGRAVDARDECRDGAPDPSRAPAAPPCANAMRLGRPELQPCQLPDEVVEDDHAPAHGATVEQRLAIGHDRSPSEARKRSASTAKNSLRVITPSTEALS